MNNTDSTLVGPQPANAETNESENDEVEVVQEVRKVGKPKHPIWKDAFDDLDAQSTNKPNHAVCKHCKETFRHHHKTLSVDTHLRKCRPFKKLMSDMPVIDRPDWWVNGIKSASQKSKMVEASSAKRNAPIRMSQQSLKSFAIPCFNATEQRKFNQEMAMYFYTTGTSFLRIENPHLLQAIQLARPGASLPSRKQLADDRKSGFLQECYQKMKTEVDKTLSSSTQYLSITSDAWSSVLNEPIVNYMAVCPTSSLFLEAVYTEEQGHNAEWIASDLARVMDNLGDKVVGAITDNTAANKKAWDILEQKYPNRFFHGCVAHGLNLLVKDIFAATKNANGKYPDGYPFEDLLNFTTNCKDIVSFFHNHHEPRAILNKALKMEKVKNLVQPAPTRWGTILGCFKSL